MFADNVLHKLGYLVELANVEDNGVDLVAPVFLLEFIELILPSPDDDHLLPILNNLLSKCPSNP
jgi:hypothetical protein